LEDKEMRKQNFIAADTIFHTLEAKNRNFEQQPATTRRYRPGKSPMLERAALPVVRTK